jgi:predicted SAM-dependent methyltransferase
MKLNLGAADRRIEGFISVDIAPPADKIVDLAGPWPWPDSSVEEVLALDVCEHIADGYYVTGDGWTRNVGGGRIHFMNELHRVLIPGGRAAIETPNAARGCGYFQDPTHVSPWCLSTFRYFEHGAFAHTRLAKAYGITAAFRIVSLTEHETPGECAPEKAWKIKAILECVK